MFFNVLIAFFFLAVDVNIITPDQQDAMEKNPLTTPM